MRLTCPCCKRLAFKPEMRWCHTHETVATDCTLLGYEDCEDVRPCFTEDQHATCRCGCELRISTEGERASVVIVENYACSNRPNR